MCLVSRLGWAAQEVDSDMEITVTSRHLEVLGNATTASEN